MVSLFAFFVWVLVVQLLVYFPSALTAFLAASSRSVALWISSPDSWRTFLAVSTLVPSRRTTRGIFSSTDLEGERTTVVERLSLEVPLL